MTRQRESEFFFVANLLEKLPIIRLSLSLAAERLSQPNAMDIGKLLLSGRQSRAKTNTLLLCDNSMQGFFSDSSRWWFRYYILRFLTVKCKFIINDWFFNETLFKLHWLREKCMKSEWKIWSSFPKLNGFGKYTSPPSTCCTQGRNILRYSLKS